MTSGSRVAGSAPVTLPAPWQATHVGGGQWFAVRRDVPGLREHCPRGESEARSRAGRYNRDAARSAIEELEHRVAQLAVEWFERREDGEWYTSPDDRLADAARNLRTLGELYRDRYPDLGPL